ncbi:MAG: hypothetical protein MSR67_03630, partial [Oscillospiraceae bacterium]|nr:hypothetical protein [Oscillospiraceae bacterium]
LQTDLKFSFATIAKFFREREKIRKPFFSNLTLAERVQPRTSRLNGRGCTRAIFRVRCPKNRPRASRKLYFPRQSSSQLHSVIVQVKS